VTWRTIAGAFLAHLATFGPAYSYGVLAVPITSELQLSTWQYSLVGGIATTLYLAMSGITGRLADRWGASWLMSVGAMLVGVGLEVTAVSANIAVLLLGYVLLFGTGISLCFVPSLAAVARSCPSRPAQATGVAASGAGLGTLLVAPGMALMITVVGWRQAVALLGACASVVLVVAAALTGEFSGVEVKPATKMRSQRRPGKLLLAALTLVGFGYYVPFVQLVPALVGDGLSLRSASVYLFVLGVSSLAGRALLGRVGDRGSPQMWLTVAVLAMAAGCLLLSVASVVTQFLAVATFGAASGAFVAYVPGVATYVAGPDRAGAQTGLFYACLATGAALGPVSIGWIASSAGGYGTAFLVAAIVLAAGGTLSGLAARA